MDRKNYIILLMKNSRNASTKQSKQGMTNKPRPEIRDDMDSRQNKERNFSGNKSKKGDRSKGGTLKRNDAKP